MNGEPMSHRKIARVLGMSKTRVQQIEAAALAKLRAGLEQLTALPPQSTKQEGSR